MLDTITPHRSRSSYATEPLAHRSWVWPLPKLDRTPSIIRSKAHSIEIGYDIDASAHRFVPVFAAHDGVITFAEESSTGYTISLGHVGGWSTHYGHLEHMFALATDRSRGRRRGRVRTGDIIGYSGRDPVRVAFEIWRAVEDEQFPVDPTDYLHNALVLPWSDSTEPRQTFTKLTKLAA